MPILFIGSGLVLLITGVKGDPAKLWELIQGEFSGPCNQQQCSNFAYWMLSILVLGALGYIDSLTKLSRLFVVLVVLVLLLDNRGFFAQLQGFVNSSQNPKPTGAGGSF
jgi:hypothetical protein